MDSICRSVGFLVITGTLAGSVYFALNSMSSPIPRHGDPIYWMKKAYINTVLSPFILLKAINGCDPIDVTIKIGQQTI